MSVCLCGSLCGLPVGLYTNGSDSDEGVAMTRVDIEGISELISSVPNDRHIVTSRVRQIHIDTPTNQTGIRIL